MFNQKYSLIVIKEKIKELKNLWKVEIELFISGELPYFDSVEKYVLGKL